MSKNIYKNSIEDMAKITVADGIKFEEALKKCAFCGGNENIKPFKQSYVCKGCRDEVKIKFHK